MLTLLLVLALNTVVGIVDMFSAGHAWVDAKHEGGFLRFLAWCVYIMSGLAFSSVLLVAEIYILILTGKVSDEFLTSIMYAWYLLVIVPVLGTGLVITLVSVQQAFRSRRLGDILVAGYNTYAMVHNTLSAVNTVPKAFGSLFKNLKGKDAAYLIAFLVLTLLPLILGFGISWIGVQRIAGHEDLDNLQERYAPTLSRSESR